MPRPVNDTLAVEGRAVPVIGKGGLMTRPI